MLYVYMLYVYMLYIYVYMLYCIYNQTMFALLFCQTRCVFLRGNNLFDPFFDRRQILHARENAKGNVVIGGLQARAPAVWSFLHRRLGGFIMV